MATSTRAKFIGDAQAATCEESIHRYAAALDDPTKQLMKSNDLSLTPKSDDVVHVRLNGSWRAPTCEEQWINGRWWVSGLID